jgi:hypothetical protein
MDQIDLRRLPSRKSPDAFAKGRIAVRRKREPLAIRRPRRPEIAVVVLRESTSLARGEVKQPKICMTATTADENELLAVGRERALVVEGRVVC